MSWNHPVNNNEIIFLEYALVNHFTHIWPEPFLVTSRKAWCNKVLQTNMLWLIIIICWEIFSVKRIHEKNLNVFIHNTLQLTSSSESHILEKCIDVLHQSTGDLSHDECSNLLTLEFDAEHFQTLLEAILQLVKGQNQFYPTSSCHLLLQSMIHLDMQSVNQK